MKRLIFAISLVGMADIVHAADVYLYDILKDPAHARSWRVMLRSSKGAPAWMRDENRFVATPAKTVSINSESYSISVISKQHATNDGQAAVMFNASASRAWAEVQETGKPKRYLGEPSVAQKGALDKALSE